MKLKKPALILAAALVFLIGASVQAQPHEAATSAKRAKTSSVRLGDKVVVIPDPEGFEEGTSQFPSIKALFEAIEAPMNDMLLGHLPVSDCTTLRNGGVIVFTRYTKVAVLKAAREIAVSDADMTDTVAEFRKNGVKMLEPDGPLATEVMRNAEKGLARLQSQEVGLDLNETQNLGEFDVRPNAYSVMLLMSLSIDSQGTKKTVPLLASLTFIKIRQRILYLNVYYKISSPEALKTEFKPAMAEVTQFAKKWVDQILAANQ